MLFEHLSLILLSPRWFWHGPQCRNISALFVYERRWRMRVYVDHPMNASNMYWAGERANMSKRTQTGAICFLYYRLLSWPCVEWRWSKINVIDHRISKEKKIAGEILRLAVHMAIHNVSCFTIGIVEYLNMNEKKNISFPKVEKKTNMMCFNTELTCPCTSSVLYRTYQSKWLIHSIS